MHPEDRALLFWRRVFSNGAGGWFGPGRARPEKKGVTPLTGDVYPQSIQPTANLDRTDDLVYHNVMELVRAVLHLKNELCQLPPEAYVMVVKVSTGQVEPWKEEGGTELPGLPSRCLSQEDPHRARLSKGIFSEVASEGGYSTRQSLAKGTWLSQKARGDITLPLSPPERGPDPAEAHRECGQSPTLLAIVFTDRGECPLAVTSPLHPHLPHLFHTGGSGGPPGQRISMS